MWSVEKYHQILAIDVVQFVSEEKKEKISVWT
jgi:hypothetical protein